MKLRFILGLWIMVSVLTGCGGATTPLATPEPIPIEVGWGVWPGWYPIVLIKELGLDQKHGIRLELTLNKDFTDDNNDWETGKFDAALGDMDQLIRRNSQKPGSTQAIFITDRSGGDTLVSAPEIKTFADLKGKRIATIIGATYGELMLQRLLEKHNLTFQDVELVNMDGNEVPGAIPDIIDAGVTWEPHLTQAKQNGFNILYSSGGDSQLGFTAFLMVRTEFSQKHPEAVQGLTKAWFEAAALWQANPEKYKDLIAKAINVSPDEVTSENINFINLAQNTQEFSDGSLVKEAEVTADFLIRTSQLNRPPDLTTLFDNRFLK